jgi:hypothetical protein
MKITKLETLRLAECRGCELLPELWKRKDAVVRASPA